MTVRKSYSRLMASLSVLPFITAVRWHLRGGGADVAPIGRLWGRRKGLEENAIIATGTRFARTVLNRRSRSIV